MRFKNLGSGSTGNATLVEAAGPTGQTSRVMVDCGLGLKHLERRLSDAGLRGTDIDAVFITHEHGDHIGCAHAFVREFRIPVWMSRGTHSALGSPDWDGLLNVVKDGQLIDLPYLQLTPFTVPHDAREPLQVTCTDGTSKLGILTDLGHATPHVIAQLSQCHALLIECNHDPELLEQSTYPAFLKHRVGGQHGHLSNQASAEIVRTIHHAGLHTVVAAHLSAQNNQPLLARQALAGAMNCALDKVWVADAKHGSPWLNVSISDGERP